MPRLPALGGTILGFHGCEAALAEQLVGQNHHLAVSQRASDWLGRGAYFWESDPVRAMEWATRERRPVLVNPVSVGAVIDLGHCLDLTRREDIEIVRAAYDLLRARVISAGEMLPENRSAVGEAEGDRLIRELDNAVINELHHTMAANGLQPYDSVRAMFREGPEAYSGAGFFLKTHVQIAVLDPAKSIRGYFWPR